MLERIVLIGHGERTRKRGIPDALDPLTPTATQQAVRLGQRLATLSQLPDLILSSTHEHAAQTAKALARGLQPGVAFPARGVASLTPAPRRRWWSKPVETPHWADDVLFEQLRCAEEAGARTVFLVGHHPRLAQLVLRFTGKRERQLEALEAMCIAAPDLASMWLGRGEIRWRYPVRNWLEAELGEKLTSKMAVATFLASANFVALFEILIAQRRDLLPPASGSSGSCRLSTVIPETWGVSLRSLCELVPPLYVIAVLSLVLAAGLFIAAVYLYDRLSMPSGFWVLRRPRGRRRNREQLLIHGYPRAHMERIWTHVFTPAVVFSILGVAMAVLATDSAWLTIGSVVIVCLVVGWYCWHRPTGSVD